MNKKSTVIIAIVMGTLLIGGGALAYSNNQNSKKEAEHAAMMKKEAETKAMKKEKEAAATSDTTGHDAMTKGGYISYADYTGNQDKYKDFKVVLYFHAPWCPTCQALDKNINANLGAIPDKTVIVKTDYDSSNDLKKKYGVTYQHTLVQVDSSGNKIKKWSGSPELKDLLAEIQT